MRSYIEVNLKDLKENYLQISRYLKKEIIAVVKSNAYGHGIIEVSRTLYKSGVRSFLVATKEEALLLRKHFPNVTIILLEPSLEFKSLYENKITIVISSKEYLNQIINSSYPFHLHLKIDTGLNRLGIKPREIKDVLSLIKSSHLILKGLFTHLSSVNTYKNQYLTFKDCLKYFDDYKNLIIHINSSSYLFKDDISTHYRVGLALYGLISLSYLKLKPILSLKSPIVRCVEIKENECVGYHNLGNIKENGYLYTIPLGYADGWIQSRTTLGYVNGIYFKQVGETCMDHIMLFSNKKIDCKNQIEILSENVDILHYSSFVKESIYQIVSLLSPRKKRIYIFH